MKRILIANAVPTNNGDAALIMGLYNRLMEQGYDVTISTLKIETIKKIYPNIKWVKAEYEYSRVEYKLMKLFPKIKESILTKKIMKNKFYNDIDVIISAPGGYINSYYGIYDRLYCLNLIKEIYNTKLVMYSQSVGPLNERDRGILKKYIKIFDVFMARDEISFENIKKYSNVIKTNDAAFLLNVTKSDNKSNVVAISVRKWAYDNRDNDKYINLMKNIIYKCIDFGYDIEFISTCQGLENYIDDSLMAKEIVDNLDSKYKEHIFINNKYYSLDELRNYIVKFKFTIGTRLHMCILSILSGIPAFNISYEVKGIECYKILNLEEYSIDYNDDIDQSIQKLKKFIENIEDLREVYYAKAEKMHREALNKFDYVIENIIER